MENKLIYCQRQIPKKQWRYGLRSSAATGCGWIAAYNALHLMGYRPAPERVIKYFEKQVPVINGNMGTFKYGPALFFRKLGFGVKLCRNRKNFDRMAKESDVAILFFWWRKKLRIGAHFVAVKYDGNGFTGYNIYRNSTGPDSLGPSLEEFIRQKQYFGCILITIRKKQDT